MMGSSDGKLFALVLHAALKSRDFAAARGGREQNSSVRCLQIHAVLFDSAIFIGSERALFHLYLLPTLVTKPMKEPVVLVTISRAAVRTTFI